MFIIDRPKSSLSIAIKDHPIFKFIKVYGDTYDWTLEATARAILYGRTDEPLIINVSTDNLAVSTIRNTCEDDGIRSFFSRHIIRSPGREPGLYIWNWKNAPMAKACFEWAEKHLSSAFPNFRELKDVHMYMNRSIGENIHVYVSDADHVTHLFCRNLTQSIMQSLQAMLPRFFPWCFARVSLTKEEMSLARSLSESKPHNFLLALEEISMQKNIKGDMVAYGINNLITEGLRSDLANYENQLEVNDALIDENMRAYDALMRERQRISILIAGCEASILNTEGDSALAEYLSRSKAIEAVGIADGRIEIVVHTCLSNYDPDRYMVYSKNDNSSLFQGIPNGSMFKDISKARMLFDEVFSYDPVVKLHMCGYYSLCAKGSVETLRNFEYPIRCKNEVPNPHIQYHACLGDNARYIREALLKKDFITAIEQCVVSAGSVNIDEAVSIKPFIRDVLKNNITPFELPSGKRVNAVDALKWIEKERCVK